MRPTRRQFIQHGAITIGAASVLPSAACRSGSGPEARVDLTDPRSPHGTFTLAQLATARAVVERILPRDETPGALELGVPEYLDRELTDPKLDFLKRPLLTLLDGVDAGARKRHNRAFAELPAASKDEILTAWQKGQPGERRCFDVLLSLTFEGAFGDPRRGGNREGAGFAMVGFRPGEVPHVLPPGMMHGAHGHGHGHGGTSEGGTGK